MLSYVAGMRRGSITRLTPNFPDLHELINKVDRAFYVTSLTSRCMLDDESVQRETMGLQTK